ncbi:phosphoribosylformylglycinamidine synthase [Acidianus ambivalens]|uniref:Phosphoribosylformylglycinamidine synthase n=1 Tax=Acidianus ambivalens TaxID=2283 RepID=A0A650CT95_ACIAM|nr:phosphoribosylformylglycinamidine synthase [Acidianus ambivalens]QGR21060.1 phosphoribosylformylglycinamidine synthase [Acidianus ambivalens]
MVLVPNTYGVIVLGFDLIMLITVLLFRKAKPKSRSSTLSHSSTRLMGYYLVVSSVVIIAISHLMIYFHSYVCYYVGLTLDSFMFYLGMVMVHG